MIPPWMPKSQHSTRSQRTPAFEPKERFPYRRYMQSTPGRGGDVHRKLGSIGHKRALAEPQPLNKLLTTHDTSNDCTWVIGFRPKNLQGVRCSNYGGAASVALLLLFRVFFRALQYYSRKKKRAEMDCFAC